MPQVPSSPLPSSPTSPDSPFESQLEPFLDSLLAPPLDPSLDSFLELSLDPFPEFELPEPEPELLRGRKSAPGVGVWTASEHKRFREAERMFPNGPWRRVAAAVGTRTIKQTISHAHKCRERRRRHALGLKTPGRKRRAIPVTGSGSGSSGSDSDGLAVPELTDLLDEAVWAEMEAMSATPAPCDGLAPVGPSAIA